MKRRIATSFIIAILMTLCLQNEVSADYILDKYLNQIPIPVTYEVTRVIKSLGEHGFMKQPKDLFIDNEDNIYIADTENNRILKLNTRGEVLNVFTQAEGIPFNKPQGVFVDEKGNIWIGDTGNQRIATLYPDGSDRKMYYKPESALLNNDYMRENFTFDPSKICVSPVGYIYVLKGTTLMVIDEHNNFRGFIGASQVNFSLTRALIRIFGTQTQKDRTLKPEPDAYTNFDIGKDGMIYGVVVSSKNGEQIKKLNSIGQNTYPSAPYDIYGEYSYDSGTRMGPSFVDIAVHDNGIITVVERNKCMIYQYDQEGNLLTAFGGKGNVKGTFQTPSAIDVDSEGNIYLLDSSTGILQVFEPTKFIKLVHQAVYLNEEGKYNEAMEYWQEVLKIDANYTLAHKGVGKLYYKEEQWKKSLESYYAAEDKTGYSKAFKEFRHQIFRKYFAVVIIIAVALIIGFIKLFILAKRKSDQLAYDIEYKERRL